MVNKGGRRMNRHDLLIEELLLRWDKHFERLLSILEKRENAKDGGSNSANVDDDCPNSRQ